MPPYPASSSSTSIIPDPSAASSNSAGGTPGNDSRLLAAIIVLGIAAAFLFAFIIYITLRLKRKQVEGFIQDPQGTVMHQDHPAAQITPFGAVGGRAPREHRPGEDMRIAIRRPDGAWDFTDSRTPFTPSGVSEIDVVPSPISTRNLPFSIPPRMPSTKEEEAHSSLYSNMHNPPPPAYYREPCKDHFDSIR